MAMVNSVVFLLLTFFLSLRCRFVVFVKERIVIDDYL